MKVEEKVKKYLAQIRKDDGKVNAFLFVNPSAIEEARALDSKKKKGRLYGYVIGVKSNINVLGFPVSCASKVLENYKGTYDASVIKKIKDEDGLIIGMLNCDEFACGSSGENSAFGVTLNPAVPGRITGGSSSGSAAAVAAGFCDVALGTDTGGSIRNPASHCGVVGVKPSYGAVSRYGMIDLSMSLDQIGPIARNVGDAALVLDIISGKDDRDTVTADFESVKLSKQKKVRVGVVRVKGVDKKIQKLIDDKVDGLKAKGWKIEEVELNYIDLAVQTYYPLVYVEFFSGTRRFDGRRYGKKIEEHCGPEVSRRILGGREISMAEFSERYYDKALQVKELIKGEFERAFQEVDCLIMPVTPGLPWKIGDKMKVEDLYSADALTSPANLAGVCALSLPSGKIDGIPVGMQVVCGRGEDGKMLSIAREIEKISL
jgi:aspartyl-tRNA(Asn)/glutamyl-tRNA(Gln) amidotransferase subunit A